MDREVVEQKLESLRRCLQRIETKCPADAETLVADVDPDTMGQTFDLLAQSVVLNTTLASSLKKAVGFRNIAVHSYETINWHIVHSIVKNHLTDFSAFAKVVSMKLDQ